MISKRVWRRLKYPRLHFLFRFDINNRKYNHRIGYVGSWESVTRHWKQGLILFCFVLFQIHATNKSLSLLDVGWIASTCCRREDWSRGLKGVSVVDVIDLLIFFASFCVVVEKASRTTCRRFAPMAEISQLWSRRKLFFLFVNSFVH